jgi:DNA-binding NarL/FixJ family response regulator
VVEANNGREAVQKATQVHPDVAILDISTPELNGLEACNLILKEEPKTRVLIVSMHCQRSW